MGIRELSVDEWAEVFRFVEPNRIVHTFDALVQSGAMGVEQRDRLDAFWRVVPFARARDVDHTQAAPLDSSDARHALRVLTEMGFAHATACEIIRNAGSDVATALEFHY